MIRPALAFCALNALIVFVAASARAPAADNGHPAAQFRAANQPALPLPDGTVVAEAEEFQPAADSAWQAKPWGQNYYAATFANTFLSRKAFLGAPEQCEAAAVASLQARIATAGEYLALVRYEAAYRFQTQFRLRIEQGGKVVLDRLYGARGNPKVWAFSEKIKPEVAWPWGAVENVVWEGHDARVRLQPGLVKLTLIAAKQPAPAARRNVDLVMLTSRLDDVRQRIEKERYLPLDGLLTQQGDVYLKLHNRGQAETTLTINKTTEHSPYWVHQREWKPKTATAAAGKSTEWIEVGGLMDCFNDGQWRLAAKTKPGAALNYEVEFGAADAAGKIASIARLPAKTAALDLAYDGDTRYSRRIRPADQVLYDLLDYLQARPLPGKPAELTQVFGYTFERKPGSDRYNASLDKFLGLFNLAPRDVASPGTAARPRGYIDVRGLRTLQQLEAACQKYKSQGLADKIAVVSLGDEIGLPAPPGNDQAGFRAWLQSQGLKPADVAPGADTWEKITYQPKPDPAANPRLFYYARRYQQHYGVARLKERSDLLRRYLPQAGVGANFSPHHGHPYLGETHKWITLFRQGGMTMPWSEDYIWQVPVGSQQMNFLGLDMFRAAVRDRPQAKIHVYVMPHWPGNTPSSWRRQFYGDLAHGMRSVDLFEFRPVQAAYTENYCSLPAMYQTVRQAFHELASFEDIVQAGRPLPGAAALWCSDTADIWDDNSDPFAAGKRTLYVAIRHRQLPLDVITEDDADKSRLDGYRILYLADRHLSRAAASASPTGSPPAANCSPPRAPDCGTNSINPTKPCASCWVFSRANSKRRPRPTSCSASRICRLPNRWTRSPGGATTARLPCRRSPRGPGSNSPAPRSSELSPTGGRPSPREKSAKAPRCIAVSCRVWRISSRRSRCDRSTAAAATTRWRISFPPSSTPGPAP